MAEWRHASAGYVASDAVEGGNDVNGEPLLVGRAWESGDLIPGKIVQSHGCCYVAYGGDELKHTAYEFLVKPAYGSFGWVRAADGEIPGGAIQGGHTSKGETLYIGRAHHKGSFVIGKVHPSHKTLYVPFGGKEHKHHEYEILVQSY